MNRYQNQMAGLSYPINLFSVLVHILAVFTTIFSQLQFLKYYEQLMLWIGLPALVISLIIIILFKGYYLLVQHARLSVGFLLLLLSLIHITALQDFGMFLNSFTSGTDNPFAFANGINALAGILAVIEFVAAIALIIGAWIRPVSIFLILLFGFYTLLFFNQQPFSGQPNELVSYSFGLDNYLLAEMNLKVSFVFVLFLTVISLVGAIFGHKIKSNSVKLNWAIIPIYTILSAGLAIVLHWYALIFIVPLAISLCLITYRSGGRIFGNHFGALLVALIMAMAMVFFQNQIGIARDQNITITNKK